MPQHDDNLGLYALLGFGAGILAFFKGFREYRKYRLLADTPEIPIRSIPMGLVEIPGQAEGEQTMPSPVSHTPCFLYKLVIERWKTQSGGAGGGWSHHRADVDGVKFYLTDGTGKVLVDAHNAELDLQETAQREAGRGQGASAGPGATEQELLQYVTKSPELVRKMMTLMVPTMRHRLESLGPQSDPNKEQARQAMLEAFNHPPGSPQFLDAFRCAEALGGEPDSRSRLGSFGDAGDQYRFTEYCIVPEHWYGINGTCVENPNPKDQHDRNMIVKGQNEPTFLITWRNQKEEGKNLRQRAARYVFGGAALATLCLAVLLAELGWF
jgi:hypothetical protein